MKTFGGIVEQWGNYYSRLEYFDNKLCCSSKQTLLLKNLLFWMPQ